MTEPISPQAICHLRQANEIAIRAQSLGHHPFGAILVAPDDETVLLSQAMWMLLTMPNRL